MKNLNTLRPVSSSASSASDTIAKLANYKGRSAQEHAHSHRNDDTKFLSKVKYSSKLSCAPAFKNLTQAKVAKVMIAKILPLLRKNPAMIYDIDLESIRVHLHNNDVSLEKDILSLAREKIDWDAIPQHAKRQWGKCTLLSMCEIDHSNMVRYQINPDLVEELVDPYSYKTVDLNIHLAFRSNYALKLYEYASQYLETKNNSGHSPFLTEDQLRTLLGVDGSRYSNTSKLIKYAIEEPLVESRGRGGVDIVCLSDARTPRMRRYCIEILGVDAETAHQYKERYEARPRRQHWNTLCILTRRYLMAEYVFLHEMSPEQRRELREDMCVEEASKGLDDSPFPTFTSAKEKNLPDDEINKNLIMQAVGVSDTDIAELEADPNWAPPKAIPIYQYSKSPILCSAD